MREFLKPSFRFKASFEITETLFISELVAAKKSEIDLYDVAVQEDNRTYETKAKSIVFSQLEARQCKPNSGSDSNEEQLDYIGLM